MTRERLLRGTGIALLMQAFFCLPVLAEPVSRSMQEIVSLALKQSAELAALEKDAAAKRSLALQAGRISNPTLELQGSTGSLSGSPEERAASIALNQELPLNNRLQLRREAGQREADAARTQGDNVARLLKDEISSMVLDAALAEKRNELSTRLVQLNRDLVSIAADRFKADDIPELEFNLAKVELVRAESRLLEVERELTPLRIRIAALTGLDENEIHLSANLFGPLPSLKSGDLVKQALASRPDLLTLVFERDRAEIERRLARAEALPNLTAGLFAQWQRNSIEVGGMSAINSDTQIGLRLSMPIPVFDRNQGGRAAAQARLDAADSRRLALERTITTEIQTASSRLSSSERILALFEQGIIPQLTENLKLTQEAYRLGEVGILSVIDEQKKFFEVNDGYLSALHGRRVALIKLETAAAINLTGGMQ